MKVHTKNILTATAFATISALVAASPAMSASLINGDFETSPLATPETETTSTNPLSAGLNAVIPGDSTTITNWTGIGGAQNRGALYQGNNRFANNGVLSRTVQLNRAGGQGGISTVISGLLANQLNTVTVFFDLSGNIGSLDPTRVDVALGTAVTQQFTLITGQPVLLPNTTTAQFNLQFETKAATFVFTPVASTALLSFVSRSGESQNFGPIIDNVTLTPVPFEFSPLTGFIAGGVLFGSYKLIKRKKVTA